MLNAANMTVLLVHGFQTPTVLMGVGLRPYNCEFAARPLVYQREWKTDFERLPEWLIADGFRDVRLTGILCNSRSAPSIETCAEHLRTQILSVADEAPDRQIVIVAHSLGGLIVRAYLETEQFERDVEECGRQFISFVMTVGTPHRAMPFHRLLTWFLDTRPEGTHPVAGQFSSKSLMEQFNTAYPYRSGVPYYLIAGTHYTGMFGTSMGEYIRRAWGANDGTVPTNSALGMDGAKARWIVPESHLSPLGLPAYFKAKHGEVFTQTYRDYLRPLLMGDPLPPSHPLPVTELKAHWVMPLLLVSFSAAFFAAFLRRRLRRA